MIAQKTIPADEALRIMSLEEGHYVDLKGARIKPAKLSRSISAFANTSGGELFVGIDEDSDTKARTWNGFADMEDANGHFQVLNDLAVLGNHYSAAFLSCADHTGLVLYLTVPKTKEILFASDGIPYVRRNAQNLPITSEASLARLKLDKGITTFEDETIAIPTTHVTNSEVVIKFMLDVVPSDEPDNWLENQFLISGDNPTVAGVLLFSDEPQAALPKRSAIKIYRYKSKEEEGTRDTLAFDPITIEGCIYDLIIKSVTNTKKIVEGMKKLGLSGLETVKYPDETLHEIITNAVLHRDYSITFDIQVRIFDNRIEVESPGRLPGHVTVKNFLEAQSARNPKIVRIINKFPDPPNKDVGEGLNTAFAAMKNLRLKEPELRESESSVIVRIEHAPLASPEDTTMAYLIAHDEITNSIARELTGIGSENSMKEVFYRLAKRNLIERVPGKLGSASAWRKPTGGTPTGGDSKPTGGADLFNGGK